MSRFVRGPGLFRSEHEFVRPTSTTVIIDAALRAKRLRKKQPAPREQKQSPSRYSQSYQSELTPAIAAATRRMIGDNED